MTRIAPFSLAIGAASGILLARERMIRLAMERLSAGTLETLLNAIDANDAETGAHVRRVAAYAIVLGEEAMLDDHTLRSIERVALFHDIGKIHAALYDIIHDDDDTLTPAERREIATHPARGAMVLAPLSRFYPDLAEGVLSHHERWDGTGYPRKLRGRRIPLSARIVTIADTFDVVSHGRPYRRGKSFETAAEVIANGRGTQFDPALVDLFLLPPVLERIIAAGRALSKQRKGRPANERRARHDKPGAPDVSFRWRRPVEAGASGGVALRDVEHVTQPPPSAL
jgi:HD-GYP domain-containing protein (c-di-GMP phosphodiesterase class II)